jgi:hypothetical protein
VQALQRGYEKAMTMELKHMRDKKHIFKKVKTGPGGGSGSSKGTGSGSSSKAGSSGGSKGGKEAAPAAAGKPSMLSFAEDEEEEG